MNYAAVECPPKVGVVIVGGGILDAPYDGAACKWGVRDAAPYDEILIGWQKNTISAAPGESRCGV